MNSQKERVSSLGRFGWVLGGGLLVGLVSIGTQSQPTVADFDDVEVHVLPVQRNVFMLVGAGGNVTVQVGDDGVLLVDTQYAALAPKIVSAIRTLSDRLIRVIVNTHVHPDHTGGNDALAKLGALRPPQPVRITAHENVLRRMMTSGANATALVPEPGLPMSS